MFDRLRRLPLATKVTAFSLLALVLFAAVTFTVTTLTLVGDAERRASERQTAHMNVAWEVFNSYGKDIRVEGDRMTVNGRVLNDFNEPVDRIKQLVGGTATIFMRDTRIATNVKKDDGTRAVGTKLAAGPTYDAVLRDGKPYRGEADILGKKYYTAYDPIRDTAGNVVGVLYVGIPAADITAGLSRLERSLALSAAIVLLVACAGLFLANRKLFAPLRRMNDAMSRLAAGEHEAEIPAADRQDEIGQMAQALVVFRDAAIARRTAEAAVQRNQQALAQVVETLNVSLTELSDGMLDSEIVTEFPEEYAALKANFNAALHGLRDLIGAVAESALTIRTGSREIADASEDLARRSESNAASLEQTSAAVNQINERLTGIADAARRTVARADDASEVVDSGRTTADRAVQAMGRVSESAKGIDSVIEGLDKIAFQTRVLAMNAAVEAGRAGEAGRGFAVVADLVSALAMRAEEEAKRARDQLSVTQSEVSTAVEAVESVDAALVRIVETVGDVNRLLGTMAADNDAQTAAVSEIAGAITEMDRTTQQNAAMVEETSAAARNLLSQVDRLAAHADRFRMDGSKTRAAPVTTVARKPALSDRLPGAVPTPSNLPAAAVKAMTAPSDGDWADF